MRNAGLRHCVARIWHHAQLRARPCALEIEGVLDRRHHVVAPMHDHTRYRRDAISVAQELIVRCEKTAIDEIVAFDPREREGVVVVAEAARPFGVLQQRQRGALPNAPRARGLKLFLRVVARKKPCLLYTSPSPRDRS